ncbi:MAG: hypothetical protein R3E96_10460 [Planctomycetota bacterium]
MPPIVVEPAPATTGSQPAETEKPAPAPVFEIDPDAVKDAGKKASDAVNKEKPAEVPPAKPAPKPADGTQG